MNSCSDMKKAMVVWKVLMPEIKMQLLLLWLYAKLQLIIWTKALLFASR